MEIDKKILYGCRYPKGTVIELTEAIDDRLTPKPAGARFRVDHIDDMLQLHGTWLPPEKGSMAVIIEKDSFRIAD